MRQRQTQRQLILQALRAGHRLTPAKALIGIGCMRLAARVQELRDEGYNITTTLASGPDGRRYAEYKLK